MSTDFKHFIYEITGINDEITLKFLVGEQGANISEPYQITFDNVVFKQIDSTPTDSTNGYQFNFDSNLIRDDAFMIWERDQWSGDGAGTLAVTGQLYCECTG